MTYTYTKTLISENNTIVKGYVDSPASTARHYVSPRQPIKAVVYVRYKGVKVTDYKLVYINATLGNVVTFPTDAAREGSVSIVYWTEGNDQPLEETATITVYREASLGVEAGINNYIITKKSPVVAPSSSYPIIITDKNNTAVTYTNSSIISITDTNREKISLGTIPIQSVTLSYYIAEGQLADLYLDRKAKTEEITQLQNYIQDVDSVYTNAINTTLASSSIADSNVALMLKQYILNFFPTPTGYTNEKNQAANIKSIWDTNRNTASYWGTTNYATFIALFPTLQTLMTTNGLLSSTIFNKTNDKNCSKIYTYLTLLGQILNQSSTITWDATNTKTFNYKGDTLGTLGTVANLIDGSALTYYTEGNSYALRLVLNASVYITDVIIEFIPSADVELLLDNVKVHLSTAKTTNPQYYNDSGQAVGTQANNASYKNIANREVHSYSFLAKIKESLKDGYGAPVQIDSDNLDFEHFALSKRDTIVIFKQSNKTNNMITEVTIKKAHDDIISIADNISNNERTALKAKVDAFVTAKDYSTTPTRIYAWRTDSGLGVSTGGLIGTHDNLAYFNAGDPTSSNRTTAWGNVKADIDAIVDSNFILNAVFMSVLTAWTAEIVGLFSSANDLDNKYKIWKKKQEQANPQYVSALNSKHTKQKDLIEKSALLEQYGALSVPT